MQLTTTTDYAIRLLLYLALTGRRTPSSEISQKMRIPQNYLMATAARLRRAGFLKSGTGQMGGYTLIKAPQEISLLDIIKVTEGTIKLNRCLEHDRYCSRFATENCAVREVYDTLQDTVEEMLGGVTLADLKRRTEERKDIA